MSTFNKKMEHNFRLKTVQNADPDRTYLNEDLIPMGKGNTYVSKYKERIRQSEYYRNHRVRKDAVNGIEVMMTYSSENVPENFSIDKWKEESIKWVQDYFGKENVISAVLHLDETNPHIHAIVIPMVNDRLCAKHYLNGPSKCSAMISDYANRMKPLGLNRGIEKSPAKHTDIRNFYAALNKATNSELPKPRKDEKLEDYFIRAQQAFRETNYQHLGELQKKERKMVEREAKLRQDKQEFYQKKKQNDQLVREIKSTFGENKDEMLKKIQTINKLNNGLAAYPERDYAKKVYSGIREIMRFEKDRSAFDQRQRKSLDELLDDYDAL